MAAKNDQTEHVDLEKHKRAVITLNRLWEILLP
jgi:hypothetical protein